MALLIYSNGMDVRVATVPNDKHLYWIERTYPADFSRPKEHYEGVRWEYCNDQPTIKELQDRIAEQELKISDLKQDNLRMHEKITRAYMTLDGKL